MTTPFVLITQWKNKLDLIIIIDICQKVNLLCKSMKIKTGKGK